MSSDNTDNTLAASVIRAVKARGDAISDSDQATVDLAMRYALQIDAGIESGGQDATKALYLGPHLLKTLGTLGCTPESRGEIGEGAAAEATVTPSSKLAALRARRATGGA